MLLRLFVLLTYLLVSLEAFSLQEELKAKDGTDSSKKSLEIFNISYDPTRELYDEYHALFSRFWKERTNQSLFVVQSHGGIGHTGSLGDPRVAS